MSSGNRKSNSKDFDKLEKQLLRIRSLYRSFGMSPAPGEPASTASNASNAKSVHSKSNISQQPVSPTESTATGVAKSPKELEARRARRKGKEARTKKARHKHKKAKHPPKTPEAQAPKLKKPSAYANLENLKPKDGVKNTSVANNNNNNNNNKKHHVPALKIAAAAAAPKPAPAPQPKPVPKQKQAGPAQAPAAAAATAVPPPVSRPVVIHKKKPSTYNIRSQAAEDKTSAAPPQKTVTESASILNTSRLVRDGRKTPDYYREVARRASSPSGIGLKSLTEFYDIPNQEFNAIDDVYAYRGYKKISKLDEGAFGIVYKAARLSDNLAVAIKEVDLSRRRSKRVEEMKRELFVLQKVDNPCIVKLIEHFIVANTLVIIMELCAGSNLTHYLKESAIQEDEALHLFRQMAIGIKIMHRKGIAHRDVKLNNFLLDASRKHVKVADFGLSVVTYKEEQGILMAKTYCGTEPYMAPEIIRRNSRGFRQYNPMYADVWALGVCLYAMLTRTFPFKMNLSQRSLFVTQTARRWRIPRNLRDNLSEELKDLLWHMLDPEPDRRISMLGVTTHPWLNPDMITLSNAD